MNGWQPAYVAVGSNRGDSRALVAAACDRIESLAGVCAPIRAAHYRTRPFGPVVQPDFVNSAVGFLTRRAPHELLAALRQIELGLGREPTHVRWGPRVIDLDLLMVGRARLDETDLTLPHPGIRERAFVLRPLADIAPSLEVPGVGQVAALLAQLPADGIEILP
jgi:2-amino-4-hydroxy-6-hydroxymethyldihydropteridine diphosphokinase